MNIHSFCFIFSSFLILFCSGYRAYWKKCFGIEEVREKWKKEEKREKERGEMRGGRGEERGDLNFSVNTQTDFNLFFLIRILDKIRTDGKYNRSQHKRVQQIRQETQKVFLSPSPCSPYKFPKLYLKISSRSKSEPDLPFSHSGHVTTCRLHDSWNNLRKWVKRDET